ncbi:cell wall-binding repeat-containing protein [Herbiconiux sp. CPCC 205763]|uniref:Cell wall-binding repeat-containing protein n=1 Tax=Herbiconiux aconitum TaxID=2970913 RepID=A0ABT2GSL6_9MICO|nr:cell wall-binding repeat-containing protein [Herbiconiux aconitum]MCS5718547.1 cell wall-binding repeat-containing protein [Herbiconiux aconitum]
MAVSAAIVLAPTAAYAALGGGDDAHVTGGDATLGATVERIGGVDRYAVSAAVAHHDFPASRLVFVASGEKFADALSASAVAGNYDAPVLLVGKDSISDPVLAELTRLKPEGIVVVGGVNSVGPVIEAALEGFASKVVRVDGPDRYAVSAKIAFGGLWPQNPTVYIASGEVFPDALSGSAAAGQQDGPVLLVQKGEVPALIREALGVFKPGKIVVLGGENTISSTVFDTLKSITANTSRVAGADRFAVSAAVSSSVFTVADTHTVYISSGAVFPDALSGSAAAIHVGAPVLLVTRTDIPEVIDAELKRLDPTAIVVLGGVNTISDAVLTQLSGYLPA